VVTPQGSEDSYQTTSTEAGAYMLDPLPVADHDVSASRPTDDIGRAISANDAVAALRIIAGLNPNGDGAEAPPLSPYQVIAADVDKSGELSILDVIKILQMTVEEDGAPDYEWLFVDESLDLWDEESTSSLLDDSD